MMLRTVEKTIKSFSIREAMPRNLYVAATGWSGNMDFMEGDRVVAVPYNLIPVNGADSFFRNVPNARWAEPDIALTAEMQRGIRRNLANVPAATSGTGA